MRFLFIRHGLSIANAEGRIQGQSDSPLSERGREQSQALGRRLVQVGDIPIDNDQLAGNDGVVIPDPECLDVGRDLDDARGHRTDIAGAGVDEVIGQSVDGIDVVRQRPRGGLGQRGHGHVQDLVQALVDHVGPAGSWGAGDPILSRSGPANLGLADGELGACRLAVDHEADRRVLRGGIPRLGIPPLCDQPHGLVTCVPDVAVAADQVMAVANDALQS